MTEIWLTTGLPASGKSTWSQLMINENPEQYVRVNLDDIRHTMGLSTSGHSKEMEDVVKRIQDSMIVAAVKSGKDVIVDNTHLNRNIPTRIKKLFDGDVTFRVMDFTSVPVDECIARDMKRENPVGEAVIRKMARQLARPWRLTEEFMNSVSLSEWYVPDKSKPLSLIVDIDGTLAEHVSRSPYDYSLVVTDHVHAPIADLVHRYSNHDGYRIIVLSGRPDINDVRRDTEAWLDMYGIPYDYLFMRPADKQQDNDADVKQYLFDKYVRHNFNVEFVLDDRNRVVQRWRKLGLRVLQVADGDF